MDLWQILLTIAIGALIIFLWYTMNFFKGTGIPHETPWPIIGNMAPVIFRKEHFVDTVTRWYTKFPEAKYSGFYDFVTPVVIIRDVELIKSIGVKNFDNFPDHRSFVNEDSDPLFGKSLFGLKGQKWREVRSLLSPAFTSSKMRQMSELMGSCAKEFAEFIVTESKQGKIEFEIKDAFAKYTNDVIASCAFGISINTMKDPNNDFYVLGKNATNLSGLKALKLFFTRFCPSLAKWMNVKVFDDKLTNFFSSIVKNTMETRQKNGIHRPDMIQLMMESKDKDNGYQLDLLDMTAQAFIFFFGGFDTSSSLMSFTSIALAMFPEIQEKLHEEIDNVMKETNGNPTYDQINSMPYLEAILYEVLRFFPIAGFLDRLCVKSFELPPALPGLKPYTVKPGVNIWFPAHAIHQDVQYYDNPEKFDPDRFLNMKVTINSPTFLAFGIGPRACIGNRFALLENKLVLFYLLTKCRFIPSPKVRVPLVFKKASLQIILEDGNWLKIVPRDSK